jgi:hypothetical protein
MERLLNNDSSDVTIKQSSSINQIKSEAMAHSTDHKSTTVPHAKCKKKKKSENQVLCNGLFITGPSHGACSPILVTLLVVSAAVANGIYAFYNEHFVQRLADETAFVLGVWTLISMLMVTFSDPGVITDSMKMEQQSMGAFF